MRNISVNIKKSLSIFLTAILVIASFPLTAFAEEITGTIPNDATFVYNTETKELRITGTGHVSNLTPLQDYYNDIESLVFEEGISSCYSSLSDLKSVKRIVIPASLSNFGPSVANNFNNLESLEEIIVADGNSAYRSVDGILYKNNSLIKYPANKQGTTFTVPSGITVIAQNAFYENKNLESVYMSDEVTTIGDQAFANCKNLKTLRLSDNITRLGNCFIDSNITEINVPAKLESIGYHTFYGCSFDEFVVPSAITEVPDFSLSYYSNKTVFPSTVTKIGAKDLKGKKIYVLNKDCEISSDNDIYSSALYCLYNSTAHQFVLNQSPVSEYHIVCTDGTNNHNYVETDVDGEMKNVCSKCGFIEGLEEDHYVGGKLNDNISWSVDLANKALILSGTGKMPDYAVGEHAPYYDAFWARLDKIIIEEGITSIGSRAFLNLQQLKSISLPSTLESIGDRAFEYCIALKEITFPDSVKTMGDQPFADCSALTINNLPASLESVKAYAFKNCKFASDIVIPGGLKKIEQDMFNGCTFTDLTISEGIETLEYRAFADCSNLSEVVLPKSLKGIYGYCFNNTKVKSIVIPEGVTTISAKCFVGSKIDTITVDENNNTYMSENDAVYTKDKSKMICCAPVVKQKEVIVPDGVKSIDESAFEESDVEMIVVPESVTELGEKAFANCANLGEVYCPGVTEFPDNMFEGSENAYIRADIDSEQMTTLDNNNVPFAAFYTTYDDGTISSFASPVSKIAPLYASSKSSNIKISTQLAAVRVKSIPNQWYTGRAITPNVSVIKVSNKGKTTKLKLGTDYTIQYRNNVNPGIAYANCVVKNSSYSDAAGKPFKIIANANKLNVKISAASYVYNGKNKTPSVTVKLGGKTLKNGNDYSVAYSNNKNIGTAVVTISGKGYYAGSINKSFVILPKAVNLKKPSLMNNTVSLKWKKQTGITGYQIQYSTNKNFKKGNKTVTVKGAKKNTYNLKKLTKNKKYYIRIRTYKTVNKKNYYSSFSKSKSVKIKKSR